MSKDNDQKVNWFNVGFPLFVLLASGYLLINYLPFPNPTLQSVVLFSCGIALLIWSYKIGLPATDKELSIWSKQRIAKRI